MLYRGSEVMREVGWVIFDEVHYMRDKERGVVWEETMILLPSNVRFVFLSATIPNSMEFAHWIAKLHQQPCHVVYTDYRPTPLQHYVFPAGGDGMYMVMDGPNFKEENFARAMTMVSDNAGSSGAANKNGRGRNGGNKQQGLSEIKKVLEAVMRKQLDPVIVFAFSKKDCEANALQMNKLDFNTDLEKETVEAVFSNAIDSLNDDDRKLPQIEHVLPLLKRGVGIHHGGLLPILKEVIEILFGEGLIKVLFATETFAMGLNMPARTVVFTSVRKFDGKDFRSITSGEYIQMSGRAGRRGKDDKGLVFLMFNEKMEPALGKTLLQGAADKLNSAFHLTYNMVLNLLRVEELNPEYMLERCFFQFQNQQALPDKERKLVELTQERDAIKIDSEAEVAGYFQITEQLKILGKELQSIVMSPGHAIPFLNPGRLVEVTSEDDNFGWGVVVNFTKKPHPKNKTGLGGDYNIIVDVLLHCDKSVLQGAPPSPVAKGQTGEVQVVPVLLETLSKISSLRINVPSDTRSKDAKLSVLKSIKEVNKRFPDGVPQLDPSEDMKIKPRFLQGVTQKIETMERSLHGHALHEDAEKGAKLALYLKKLSVIERHKACKKDIKQSKSILQLDELKRMKRVLRRLEFTTAEDVITLKGRVACEISTGDALVLTEMIFNGVFNDLDVHQYVQTVRWACAAIGDSFERHASLLIFVFGREASLSLAPCSS